MDTIRLAAKNDLEDLKVIWKLCFKDRDDYIDFYYNHRYMEEETVVLEQEGKVVSMVTVFPVQTVTSANLCFDSVMLYAFATHPDYQGRGLASQIMKYCHQRMLHNKQEISVLVPERLELFEFYRRQGYQESFDVCELVLTKQEIEQIAAKENPQQTNISCSIRSVSPQEYNLIRNKRLQGRFHIAYPDQDILYQKKLSQASGEDIYKIEIGEIQGCMVVERISPEAVLFKELLLAEEWIPLCLAEITKMFSAHKYRCRLPSYLGKCWGAKIRPFGMMKQHSEASAMVGVEGSGYMGLAFD